jgi:DNA-binding transcriptional LysR family regulator
MYEGPEFRHLISFVAVAEECHFGKASQRLHITQPALSAQIKQLESWLGAHLFRRTPHGAELTEAGRNFLLYARRILHMRKHAMKATSRKVGESEWPLRFGYTPFTNHDLIREAILGYREIVPEGNINSTSDCTARLIDMLLDGRLDAAVVTPPLPIRGLLEHRICEDKLLLCLRSDDPLALAERVPKEAVTERLCALFNRDFHPALYDQLIRRFKRAGMDIHPTEIYSAPAEMQFIVKTRGCFGLVRDRIPLEPGLTARPISGVDFRLGTELVCHRDEQRPAITMLAYRMVERCIAREQPVTLKRPPGRVLEADISPLRKGQLIRCL